MTFERPETNNIVRSLHKTWQKYALENNLPQKFLYSRKDSHYSVPQNDLQNTTCLKNEENVENCHHVLLWNICFTVQLSHEKRRFLLVKNKHVIGVQPPLGVQEEFYA